MKVQLNVMVDSKTLSELDQYANRLKMSRSQLMRLFITNGLEEAKDLEQRGLSGLAACDRATQRKFQAITGMEVLPHGLS